MNIQAIICILDREFPDPTISLNFSDPFTLLIATLLSARCTDKRVNMITKQLFQKAKTPEAMAKLSIKELEEIIRPCGLAPTKSRAIIALSKELIKRFHGAVPRTMQSLESLPGVGHKTASVVLIIAFHRPAFPVDTHIHRLARRWKLSRAKNVRETERDLKRLFPKKDWAKRHLQMILFGRTFCKARGHKIADCPVCLELYRLYRT